MKNLIVVLLALIGALATTSAQAEATWRHFGADKAYESREAAITDAPQVLKQVGYPEPVIALLTEAMKQPGKEVHVTNGMKLDFMRSGKTALWRNVLVRFDQPPVKERMEYSAPAEEWSVDWNRETWTVGIPQVCENLYGKRSASLPPIPSASPTALPSASVFVTNACPSGYTLIANAWSLASLPSELRKEAGELIDAANARNSKEATALAAYQPPDVSRTLGKQLRESGIPHAQVSNDVRVRYLDQTTGQIVQELVR